jgi:hypothetical protein
MALIRTLIVSIAIVPCFILLLPAIVVIATVLTFASAVRAVARRLEPPCVPWTDLTEFDRRLGWKPRANLDSYYFAENDDVFRIVTDREGWPGSRTVDAAKVVVIGDSFAFGYGMDTNRGFAALTPGLSVKAVGAPGYSMVQGVRLMEQLGERLRGKLVVWFAFLENDLQDNLTPEMRGYRAPFVRWNGAQGTWEIVDRHIERRKWDCSYLDPHRLFATFCVPGPAADRAYAASDFLIHQGRLTCERVNARLVVVTIPHPLQLTSAGRQQMAILSGAPESCDPGMPDRRIAESCRVHGVPLVIGMHHLSSADYKRREGIHWNQLGHQRMASLLKRLHELFESGRIDELLYHAAPGSSPSERPAATVKLARQSLAANGAGTRR